MINKTTYADFWTYVHKNKCSKGLYWFLSLIDNNSNTYGFTNYFDPNYNVGYIPSIISISSIISKANLFDGSYIISPIHVEVQNISNPNGDGTYSRFSDNFSSNEFETEFATIYIGYEGQGYNDLVPIYKGRMANFKYNILSIEFDIIDRAIFELPQIPKNKFTQASYPYIDKDMIDKPIPIVYGKWDYVFSGNDRYIDQCFIPGYVIENKINSGTPQIVLEFSDMAIDDIQHIWIFDDKRNVPSQILDDGDTISEDLANGRATINLFDYSGALLDTLSYFYPDKTINAGGVINREYSIDGRYDTYAQIQGINYGTLDVNMKTYGKYTREELEPQYSDSTGEITRNINAAIIQFSGYGTGTWSSGQTLTIKIVNSTFSQVLDYAAINALSDVSSFNFSSNSLQITYNYNWDGSTNIFTLREADDASGTNPVNYNIQPAAGVYWTMSDMASEIEKQIRDSACTNTYSVSYLPYLNKFRIERITAGADPYFKIIHTTRSDDIGFNGDSGFWKNTYQESQTYTVLDIPDGNISLVKPYLQADSYGEDKRILIKGIRLRVQYAYRDYIIYPFGWGALNRPGRRVQGNPRARIQGIRIGSRTGEVKDQWRTGTVVNDYEYLNQMKETLSGSKFFMDGDGRPDATTSYYKTGPYIIKSILYDYIGIAAADINSTAFGTANGISTHEMAIYLSSEENAISILNDIAKFSMGFFHRDHQGDYTMTVLNPGGYSADFEIYLRDVKQPLQDNFKIKRNEIKNINKDLYFYYCYNHVFEDYELNKHKQVTTDLNLEPQNMICPYINNDTDADTLAEHFSGDGATKGFFGELHSIIEMTTLNPEFQFAELGDICVFNSEFDSYISDYLDNLSAGYYMINELQKSLNEIKLELLYLEAI